MKRIIASILIPAFLIQIIGCYSNSEITIDELEQHKKDDIKLVTKDSTEYWLKYNSELKKSNWEISDSIIYVTTKKLVSYSSGSLIDKVDTTTIPITSIKELYKHTFNIFKTASIIVLGIVSLIFIIRVYGTYRYGLLNNRW